MQILSDTAELTCEDLNNIEVALSRICGGTVLRWAIVEVADCKIKVSFSCKQQ